MCQPRPSYARAGSGCRYVDPALARLAQRSCRLHTSISTKHVHVHIDINIQYRLKMDFSILLAAKAAQ